MSTIRINEATFKRIIAESVRGVLNEISPELKAAAAMTAADRSYNVKGNNGIYAAKLRRQANNFANAAESDYEKQNPTMTNVRFDPYNRGLSATFNGYNDNGNSIRYSDDNFNYDKNQYNDPSHTAVDQFGVPQRDAYNSYDTPENGFVDDSSTSDKDVRRYGRFKNHYFNTRDKIRNYKSNA